MDFRLLFRVAVVVDEEFFLIAFNLQSKKVIPPVDRSETAMVEDIVFPSKGGHLLMPVEELHVFPAPGVGATVVWICIAFKSRFVTIIDAGNPGHGHLEQDHDLQTGDRLFPGLHGELEASLLFLCKG